eukprot:356657-Chlamydomonas_euryale.AAC.3
MFGSTWSFTRLEIGCCHVTWAARACCALCAIRIFIHMAIALQAIAYLMIKLPTSHVPEAAHFYPDALKCRSVSECC